MSMLYGSMDPNERFRARRDHTRRRKRRRRAALLGVPLLAAVVLGAGWQLRTVRAHPKAQKKAAPAVVVTPTAPLLRPRPLPVEIRGIHVTAALASLPGKLAEYAKLRHQGLNTIELDIKDEGGDVGGGLPDLQRARACRDRERNRSEFAAGGSVTQTARHSAI